MTDASPNYSHLFNLVVVGESGVGKTSLVRRFTEDTYPDTHVATTGVDFEVKDVQIDPNDNVKVRFWDTEGRHRYEDTVLYKCCPSTDGLVVVYDVTDADSFGQVRHWFSKAEHYGDKERICSRLLIGNKCDLQENRVVSREAAEALAGELGMDYVETSVKDATKVSQAFLPLVHAILDVRKTQQNEQNDNTPKGPDYDCLLRIVMLGSNMVGKTSLQKRFADDTFTGSVRLPTIGVDFETKIFETAADGRVKLTLWDTAGSERTKRIVAEATCRQADGLIFVYDITDADSFRQVREWFREAEENYGDKEKICSRLLIGNKCDKTHRRVVSREAAEQLARELGMDYMETSAKDATNVPQVFMSMAHTILDMRRSRQNNCNSNSRCVIS